MSHFSYTIHGRITRQDTHEGVHGLTVEAWDDDRNCDDCLGYDLTNRDGTYIITFSEEDFKEPGEGAPEIYLKIRDCHGRLIHDTRSHKRICDAGHTTKIDVGLVPDVLYWHLQQPGSWDCLEGNLLPKIVLEDIQEAISRLGGAREGIFTQHLELLLCAIPRIELLNGILEDAWDTLQGDLDAAGRYRDLLDALCATTKGDRCGCDVVDDIFAKPKKVKKTKCPPPYREPDPCKDDECKKPHCPCRPSLIDPDKTKILVMAALHIACGHKKTAKTYVKTILDQIARFEFLASLHRAAVKSLCGDEKGTQQFRDLLELFLYPGVGIDCGCLCGGLTCCGCLDDKLVKCLREMVGLWRHIHCYTVEKIHPARACPGEEIIIKGCGFGDRPGYVAFREKRSLRYGPQGIIKSWCDDQIVVEVPDEAGCGLILCLPLDTVKVCGRFLEYRPTGCLKDHFEGTSAEILQFSVKGHKDGDCIEPGRPLQIRWKTCATDRVRIQIINAETGFVLAALDPADPRGRWNFTNTHFTQTTRVTIRILAEGQCSPPQQTAEMTFTFQRQPNLTVQGLEVTQAIQHYRADQHLTDPADRGPDNSLRLVTDKTAWVRVYLRSGQSPLFDNGQVAGVTGSLTVERRVGGVWGVVAVLAPQNGPINAEDAFVSYDAERGNINTTLNFVVPANLMTGLLRFTANVESEFADCPGNRASGSETVDVNLTQTLNAAFITIGYNGPDAGGMGTLNLPAPNLATCQAETTWAMTTFPVSGAPNVRIAGTFVTNTPLNDPRSCPGCCSPNWGILLPQVAALVAADIAAVGGNWVYYGIINNGIPVNVPGCNGWGATGGLAGRPLTYGHEIGHQFGLPHARCGNAGAGNAAYPIYEPYDLPVDVPAVPISDTSWTMASIGEYGLDINNGNIANPNTAEDFMSYCGPRWISRFTHNYLINRLELDPTVIPTGFGGGAPRVIQDTEAHFTRSQTEVEPLILMLGSADDDGDIEMLKVARLDTVYLVGDGIQSNYIAQLLGEDGQILSQDVVYAYESQGCGSGKDGGCGDCGCREDTGPFLLKALLDDVAPGQTLRLVKKGEVVWERTAPPEPPRLTNVRAIINRAGNVSLSWRATGKVERELEYWVRWSRDGERWHALTVGVTENSFSVDPDLLPSGDIYFQIMAHDGFHTTTAVSKSLNLPERPPAAAILYPREGDVAYADRQLHLWGTAASGADRDIPDGQFVWTIDGKEVGRGRDIWVDSPGAGVHKVHLAVTDGELTGTADSVVEILS